jgi:putative ABC transport system permease protein
VYVPFSRRPSADIGVVVRSAGADPLQLVPAIRARVADIDRDQPIDDVASMSQVLFDDLAGTYVLTALLAAIGACALAMAAAGVYGLVSYSVAQRAREIGVRVALGARPGVVVRMVLLAGVRPVAAGSVIGLVVALVLTLGIAFSLPGVDTRGAGSYAGVVLTIAGLAFFASYVPARRAASIDPVAALRQ